MVTSLSSFISQEASFEFLEALENSELYTIKRGDFYELIEHYSELGLFYKNLLEKAYIYLNKRIENLVTLDAKERYNNLLKENPIYVQRISNKILATYLDISQETLSRLKAK
jgi:CRP-like cAMP-binding protein